MTSRASRLLVFDSGTGGLGITAALRTHLPQARIDYLADTALFPYGDQPDERLILHIVALLRAAVTEFAPDAVVVACNTASTLALSALRAALPGTPFAGCVPPVRWAARLSRTRVIGLLATPATVRRPYVAELQATYAPDCHLVACGARHLAALAEQAFRHQPVSREAVSAELEGLFAQPGGERIDVVGLGCTHYPFLLPLFRELSPRPEILWLDPADAVARRTAEILPPLHGTDGAEEPDRYMTTSPHGTDAALLAALPAYGFRTAMLWQPRTAEAVLS
ncbi:aspartate/glutamate racemase family protein [Acetobacter sp. AN02]|uniref:glutamate racemase n=1 Tax=Acetobacter sp. AN02 TaxID=2894186 RepID=UPI002434101A|nr:aspartate/glutamate racemase family protein [Acetobacter sp. AN02]MDG6095559.1 aspartate/glutamate racemase family protein [Acetobacter sp. AN02]